jgi:hypothetical protein
MNDTQEVLSFLSSMSAEQLEGSVESALETNSFRWRFRIGGLDKLGLLLAHLGVEAKQSPSIPLAKQVELIIRKLTYLDEGFKLLEHDLDHQTLSLRSSLRPQRNDKTRYFEIVLQGGIALNVDHYEFDRTTSQRRLFAANLSRETFERLIEDLQTILA